MQDSEVDKAWQLFSKSKLPLFKWLLLMQLWSRQHPVCDAADNADISEKTTIDSYQFFRDVCTTKLLQAPIKLGGPGVVVQTEELLFNHKPKVSALLCNVVFIHIIKLFIQVMDIISNSTVPLWPCTST